MTEILEGPPEEEEGDNAEAGGGNPAEPVKDDELADADALEEDDYEDEADEPEA